MNSPAFTDIRIVDLDVELTRPSTKASGLRHMFLRLSNDPPLEWIEFFNAERRFPRHSMWRHAWIEGQHIVVDCVPEEIERHHLPYLKEEVSTANDKYREHLQILNRRKISEEKAAVEEEERLKNVKANLKFE